MNVFCEVCSLVGDHGRFRGAWFTETYEISVKKWKINLWITKKKAMECRYNIFARKKEGSPLSYFKTKPNRRIIIDRSTGPHCNRIFFSETHVTAINFDGLYWRKVLEKIVMSYAGTIKSHNKLDTTVSAFTGDARCSDLFLKFVQQWRHNSVVTLCLTNTRINKTKKLALWLLQHTAVLTAPWILFHKGTNMYYTTNIASRVNLKPGNNRREGVKKIINNNTPHVKHISVTFNQHLI